jgi:DNA polymerase III alpha subunit
MLRDVFGDKCYLEITAQDESLLPITKRVNKFIYNLAKQTNTKLIVNNEYRYLKEKDKNSWEIALSIKDGTKMYDANRRKPA